MSAAFFEVNSSFLRMRATASIPSTLLSDANFSVRVCVVGSSGFGVEKRRGDEGGVPDEVSGSSELERGFLGKLNGESEKEEGVRGGRLGNLGIFVVEKRRGDE